MEYCFILSGLEGLWARAAGNFGPQERCFWWKMEERGGELREKRGETCSWRHLSTWIQLCLKFSLFWLKPL